MEYFIAGFSLLLQFLESAIAVVVVFAAIVVWAVLIVLVLVGEKWSWYKKLGAFMAHIYFVCVAYGSTLDSNSLAGGHGFIYFAAAVLMALGILAYGVWVNGMPKTKSPT